MKRVIHKLRSMGLKEDEGNLVVVADATTPDGRELVQPVNVRLITRLITRCCPVSLPNSDALRSPRPSGLWESVGKTLTRSPWMSFVYVGDEGAVLLV